jgi:type IV pilus assembly protein PilM
MKIGGRGEGEAQDVVPHEVEEAMRSVTDTVLGEITRSLDFFAATAAESRISKVFLSGGGAQVSGLDAAFQQKTNLPVERLNPLARVSPASKLDEEFLKEIGPALGVGIGLSLRRMDD